MFKYHPNLKIMSCLFIATMKSVSEVGFFISVYSNKGTGTVSNIVMAKVEIVSSQGGVNNNKFSKLGVYVGIREDGNKFFWS